MLITSGSRLLHVILLLQCVECNTFITLKNKNKNISQNGVAPRSWRVFSYYNSIASSINPQILNLISSKLIKFVCDCDIKKEKKGEMEAIDSVFDPLREFAKDSVRLVKRCHKPDRKGIYLITNHIQNPPLCFFQIRCWISKYWTFLIPNIWSDVLCYCYCRVHQGGVPYGHRVRGYGVRWLLRQAHLHPHQQHHRWLLLMFV